MSRLCSEEIVVNCTRAVSVVETFNFFLNLVVQFEEVNTVLI